MGKPRVPNIKLGKGSKIKVGHSILQNQNKTWSETGDGFTYQNLIDRPDYYLGKFSKAFNVSYNKYEAKKDKGLHIVDPKEVQNPNKVPLVDWPTFRERRVLKGAMSGALENPEYYDNFIDNEYKLAYFDPHAQEERISRPVKYYHTCEEIQYIIDNDLVSGVSGYDVSSAGNIQFPQWGPYLIEARSTGQYSGIYIKPGTQTDPEFISGSIEGYDGDVNDYSSHILRHYKTGSGLISTRLYFTEFRKDVQVNAGITVGIFDFNVGTYINRSQAIQFVSGWNAHEKNTFNHQVTGSFYDSPNCIMIPNKTYKIHVTHDINVDFDAALDPEDTQKIIHATGARPHYNFTKAQTTNIYPSNKIPFDLDVGANEYTSEKYFQYGAPSGFCGHKYDTFRSIKIKDNPEIRAFRIPLSNEDSIFRTLKSIEVTNCSNLDYYYVHPNLTPNLKKIDFSGCNINFDNYHKNDEDQFNNLKFRKFQLAGKKITPSGVSNIEGIFQDIPDYARYNFYNALATDSERERLQPNGCTIGPIPSNFVCKHINFAGNDLNQTGVLMLVLNCFYRQLENGYLNVSNQKPRAGRPENAVFNGERADAYANSFTPINKFKIQDVNNLVLTGITLLRNKGWTVIYDGHGGETDLGFRTYKYGK